MITALISAGFGALNALLPDIMGFFKRRQEMDERAAERAHELMMIDKQVDAQLKIGAQKLEEVRTGGDYQLANTEIAGQFEQMKAIITSQATSTGIKWVDAWNALVRPATATLVMMVFSLAAGCIIYGTMQKLSDGIITPEQAGTIILGGLIGETIMAVLGYLFGYRGTNAARKFVGG